MESSTNLYDWEDGVYRVDLSKVEDSVCVLKDGAFVPTAGTLFATIEFEGSMISAEEAVSRGIPLE